MIIYTNSKLKRYTKADVYSNYFNGIGVGFLGEEEEHKL